MTTIMHDKKAGRHIKPWNECEKQTDEQNCRSIYRACMQCDNNYKFSTKERKKLA